MLPLSLGVDAIPAATFMRYYRRPKPVRVEDIGEWYSVLEAIGKVAVLMNTFIYWHSRPSSFPSWFTDSNTHPTRIHRMEGRWRVTSMTTSHPLILRLCMNGSRELGNPTANLNCLKFSSQKRSPGRTLEEHRLVWRSCTTSTLVRVVSIFCLRMRRFPENEVTVFVGNNIHAG